MSHTLASRVSNQKRWRKKNVWPDSPRWEAAKTLVVFGEGRGDSFPRRPLVGYAACIALGEIYGALVLRSGDSALTFVRPISRYIMPPGNFHTMKILSTPNYHAHESRLCGIHKMRWQPACVRKDQSSIRLPPQAALSSQPPQPPSSFTAPTNPPSSSCMTSSSRGAVSFTGSAREHTFVSHRHIARGWS